MDLFSLIAVLVVVGVILYLVNNYIPMQAPFKTVINVVAVIALCLFLLSLFGIGNIHVGR